MRAARVRPRCRTRVGTPAERPARAHFHRRAALALLPSGRLSAASNIGGWPLPAQRRDACPVQKGGYEMIFRTFRMAAKPAINTMAKRARNI